MSSQGCFLIFVGLVCLISAAPTVNNRQKRQAIFFEDELDERGAPKQGTDIASGTDKNNGLSRNTRAPRWDAFGPHWPPPDFPHEPFGKECHGSGHGSPKGRPFGFPRNLGHSPQFHGGSPFTAPQNALQISEFAKGPAEEAWGRPKRQLNSGPTNNNRPIVSGLWNQNQPNWNEIGNGGNGPNWDNWESWMGNGNGNNQRPNGNGNNGAWNQRPNGNGNNGAWNQRPNGNGNNGAWNGNQRPNGNGNNGAWNGNQRPNVDGNNGAWNGNQNNGAWNGNQRPNGNGDNGAWNGNQNNGAWNGNGGAWNGNQRPNGNGNSQNSWNNNNGGSWNGNSQRPNGNNNNNNNNGGWNANNNGGTPNASGNNNNFGNSIVPPSFNNNRPRPNGNNNNNNRPRPNGNNNGNIGPAIGPFGARPPSTPSPNCDCPSTAETNPVCGTDGITYINPSRLRCARVCGADVQMQHYGTCPATTPSPDLRRG